MVQPTLKVWGCPSRRLENTLPLLQLLSNVTIRSKNRSCSSSRSSRSRSRPRLHSCLLAMDSQLDPPPGLLLYDSHSATHTDSAGEQSSRTSSPTGTAGSLVPSIPPCATPPPSCTLASPNPCLGFSTSGQGSRGCRASRTETCPKSGGSARRMVPTALQSNRLVLLDYIHDLLSARLASSGSHLWFRMIVSLSTSLSSRLFIEGLGLNYQLASARYPSVPCPL